MTTPLTNVPFDQLRVGMEASVTRTCLADDLYVFANSSGNAFAHAVIVPAPRQTTMSPDRARPSIVAANSAGPANATTDRRPLARRPSIRASRSIPSSGASPAAYTSATTTTSASLKQVQKWLKRSLNLE